MPSRASAAASWSARAATSANEARRLAVALEGDDLAVAVDAAAVAEDHPDVSGKSCIVDCIIVPFSPWRARD